MSDTKQTLDFKDVYNAIYSQLISDGKTAAADKLNALYDQAVKDPANAPSYAKQMKDVGDANLNYSTSAPAVKTYMDNPDAVRTEWGFTDAGLAKALGPYLGGKNLYSSEPGEGWITTAPAATSAQAYAAHQKAAIEKAYGNGSFGPAMEYLRNRSTEEARKNVAAGRTQSGSSFYDDGQFSPSELAYGVARNIGGKLSGFFTPRMNETIQRGETPYNPADVGLDLGENALMTAPLGTAGSVLGRVATKIAPAIAGTTAAKLGGKLGRTLALNSIVPAAMEVADAAAYDDPENPRSEANIGDIATGTAVNIATPMFVRGSAAGIQGKLNGMGPRNKAWTRALSHVGENPYTQAVPEARAKWEDMKTIIPVNEQGVSPVVKTGMTRYNAEFPTAGVSANDIANVQAGNPLGTGEAPSEMLLRAENMNKLYNAIDEKKAKNLYSSAAGDPQMTPTFFTNNGKPIVLPPIEGNESIRSVNLGGDIPKTSKKINGNDYSAMYAENASKNPQVLNAAKLSSTNPDIAGLFTDPVTREDAIAAIAFDPNFVPTLPENPTILDRIKHVDAKTAPIASAFANEMLPAWYVNKIGKSDNAQRAAGIVPGFSTITEYGNAKHDEAMQKLAADKKKEQQDPDAGLSDVQKQIKHNNPKGFALWQGGNRYSTGLTKEQLAALNADSIQQLRGNR